MFNICSEIVNHSVLKFQEIGLTVPTMQYRREYCSYFWNVYCVARSRKQFPENTKISWELFLISKPFAPAIRKREHHGDLGNASIVSQDNTVL